VYRSRLLSAALAAGLISATAVPALAGDQEVAFLQSLAGQYSGAGEITGEDGGPVKCRMTFKPSGAKLNYTGRCSVGGGSQSFSGSIRYDDSEGRWESSSKGQTIPGQKNEEMLVFASRQRTSRGTVTSVMRLSPSAVSVSFEMEAKNGDLSAGTIPFARS
jgi:hypothetical protein